jgi:trk system potassium uptake protein TrkA
MRIIVIGAGDIGMPIIHYLSERGHILTVIEKDEERCHRIANHADAAIFQGEGTDPDIWKNIEAEKTDALLALTNDDDVNVRVVEMSKRQFGIPIVISRAHEPENISKIKDAGADIVICPSDETRRLFLNALERKGTEILCENVVANFKTMITDVPPDGTIVGKNIGEMDVSDGTRIVGVLRDGAFIFVGNSFVLRGGDKVLLLGACEHVDETAEKLRKVEYT